jgi:hypothetical protein
MFTFSLFWVVSVPLNGLQVLDDFVFEKLLSQCFWRVSLSLCFVLNSTSLHNMMFSVEYGILGHFAKRAKRLYLLHSTGCTSSKASGPPWQRDAPACFHHCRDRLAYHQRFLKTANNPISKMNKAYANSWSPQL